MLCRTRWAAAPCLAMLFSCSVAMDPDAPRAGDHAAGLYATHCASCHGPSGRGDGPIAPFLFPEPRDFAAGTFRLVSTDNAIPTHGDLERVLRRGVPGSAMPSFAWLPDADIAALATTVRELGIAGMAGDFELDGMSPNRARRLAQRRMTPGQELPTGRPSPTTELAAARGKALFDAHCVRCHGENAKGTRPATAWDECGDFQWARDFTTGVLKGGASHRELAWRIRAGLPGTTMPATAIRDPRDLGALVAYVQGLIEPGAADRLVQKRQRIRARRIDGDLPAPDSAAWDAGEVGIALSPLLWRRGAPLTAKISCVHDGEKLGIRLRWRDASRDDDPLRSAFGDGAAVQLSDATEPPPLGMGSPQRPADIWHWKTFVRSDVSAMLEQAESAAGSTGGLLDTPFYRSPRPSSRAVRAKGFHSAAAFAGLGRAIESTSQWDNGMWNVVFVRELSPPPGQRFALQPGGEVQIAVALWDGASRTDESQKSLTIWHALRLDR